MDLSKWTTNDLKAALTERGYESNDIIKSEFSHVTKSHNAVFKIFYKDNFTGQVDTGNVYVFIDTDGKLVADY